MATPLPRCEPPTVMPARPILVDMTRLITRLGHASPSGIDRVDLAYARRYLTDAPGRHGAAVTPFGPRLLPDAASRRLLRTVVERWSEDVPAAADPVLAELRARLAGATGAGPATAREPRRTRHGAATDALARLGGLRWARAASAPHGSVYLHTSHLRLDRPQHFAWLQSRPDIRPVFFVHDLIPIDFPEYVVPGEADRHRTRMATIARHAAAVIVNSHDVKARLQAHLGEARLRIPPVAVAWLGVEQAFLDAAARRGAALGRPYAVICGTIEARKNHLLLLQIWRDLAGEHGPDIPALVVVGRRGWESESAVDLLDRCPSLRGHVIEAAGLSTAGLVELVSGARALLMPSFAEGYGIPVVEALSLGTPVIASDLPVHREIAGGHATFLHPLDGPGWRDAIARSASLAGPEPATADPYRPPTWAAHFGVVDDVLAGL